MANLRNKLKSLSFSRVSEVALGPFLCYFLGTKLGGWPQDVANLRNKLKSLSFSRVSEMALGPLFRVPLLRFGHKIRCCFAVAHVPQSHALCDLAGLLAARCGKPA